MVYLQNETPAAFLPLVIASSSSSASAIQTRATVPAALATSSHADNVIIDQIFSSWKGVSAVGLLAWVGAEEERNKESLAIASSLFDGGKVTFCFPNEGKMFLVGRGN